MSGKRRGKRSGEKADRVNLGKEKSGTRRKMSASGKKLIIVESPAKARTISQIVGDEFVVESTMGHIMDLPERKFGVDLENGFTPEYVIRSKRKNVVKMLKEMAKEAEEVYLASDPDREGEAIAWHVAQIIKRPDAKRIEFHEVTKPAILKALQNPRDIDTNLVNAQQARRVLDRIFGYTLSPLLWQKIRKNLSAGRVQSVALRLVVEREREIQNFAPQEYWSITATLTPEGRDAPFDARLVQIGEQKVAVPEREIQKPESDGGSEDERTATKKNNGIIISSEAEAKALLEVLKQADYLVLKAERGERKRTPPPPFITSTLQQAASRQLGFNPSRTMRIAQQLYEGIDLGEEGRVGLITYMRTDSPRVSEVARAQLIDFIKQTFGESYLPPQPRQFKARKTAQEAHEAIRPTSVFRTPEKVKPYLTKEQFALYSLIWRRFVASQMADAIYDTLTVDIAAKVSKRGPGSGNGSEVPEWLRGVRDFLFKAAGRALKFDGWLKVYSADAEEEEDGKESIHIPELVEGEVLRVLELKPEQHFTKPPARYTQATLVKALEELGIGRPSTYAPTVDTIVKRGYAELKGKQLIPTPLGMLVCDKLVQFFPNLLSVDFTAQMEGKLDDVEEGERDWQEAVRYFYEPFKEALERAKKEMSKEGGLETGQKCPLCGASLIIKFSAYGPFLACERYPRCRALIPLEEGATKNCPHCEGTMVRRGNKNMHYFLCLKCAAVESADGQELVKCPQCGDGVLIPKIVRKGKMRGRTFFSCSRYPDCRFAIWDKPVPTPCPKCNGLMVEKQTKDDNPVVICNSCGYIEDWTEEVGRMVKTK